jgi:hypothetical protein
MLHSSSAASSRALFLFKARLGNLVAHQPANQSGPVREAGGTKD